MQEHRGAVTGRRPAPSGLRRPGLVPHSDRGVQDASEADVTLLQTHHMIPRMRRPANPYDHAGCAGVMKTLTQEELSANTDRDLDHRRTHT